MSLSISSSDPEPARWRRFLRVFAATAAGLGMAIYLFIVTVDPWNMLPLSPPLARAPISTNARFSMPALASSSRFDSAIIGTSTSRLLRPDRLDQALGARFANLSMNSATPWEQGQMLALFTRHHSSPKAIVVGLDSAWCLAFSGERTLTGRPFPEWMYTGSPWRGYLHMANLYALQEAANQFMLLIHAKRQRYGSDGYTNFLPAEDRYDPKRVDRTFAEWDRPQTKPVGSEVVDAPALAILADGFRKLPAPALKILYLPPISDEQLGPKGSLDAAKWASCRTAATRIAETTPNAVLVDFAYPNSVTSTRSSFWDPVHYRAPIADRVMQALAHAALTGEPAEGDIDRVLVGPSHTGG